MRYDLTLVLYVAMTVGVSVHAEDIQEAFLEAQDEIEHDLEGLIYGDVPNSFTPKYDKVSIADAIIVSCTPDVGE